MRTSRTFAASAIASCLFLAASAQFVPNSAPARRPDPQAPLRADIPLHSPSTMSGSNGLSISDVIGRERNINIFAGFARDVDVVADRLDSITQNTTVLAPINEAITKLPRKPWEDPRDYAAMGESAYHGQSGEDRAQQNLKRFVEAHIVPESPWEEGQKVQSLAGEMLWWEKKDGKKFIQPGNIEVDSVPNRVANGEIWVLRAALNYA